MQSLLIQIVVLLSTSQIQDTYEEELLLSQPLTSSALQSCNCIYLSSTETVLAKTLILMLHSLKALSIPVISRYSFICLNCLVRVMFPKELLHTLFRVVVGDPTDKTMYCESLVIEW